MATITKIFGRQQELKILDTIYTSDKAELLALYGRRRIGKTFLISEYFKNKGIYFELTGIKGAKPAEQLRNFVTEMSDTFWHGQIVTQPKNWQEAFTLLRREIEKTLTTKKIILFFDELPWLASARSKFLAALDHFWNRYASRNKQVIVIICGSATSWMIKKIANSKGGLHGRITREMRLLPFDLTETEGYLRRKNIELDRKQIIDIYMSIGGVPKYLSYIERGKSANQIINDLCFSPNGPLFKEFNKLYHSLFDHAEHHIKIIKELAKKSSGLSQDELLKKVGLTSGGTASDILNELEESGFIIYIPTFSKGKIYKLTDEYSLFYISWIATAPKTGLHGIDKDYWLKKQHSRAYSAWAGHAFETICLKHIRKIKAALGITAVSTTESSWLYKPTTKEQKGAQIDLVIDRTDNCINLCEIKYYNKEFTVSKQYADELTDKKHIFLETTNTKKTLFTTLITTYGAVKNTNYLTAVDNQLTIDDLF